MPQQRERNSTVVLAHRGSDGEPVIVLAGALTGSCVRRFRDTVMEQRNVAQRLLRIDMSRVSAVDPVGIRTLVACRRLAAAAGVDLLLVHPSWVVSQRLGLGRSANTFGVERGIANPPTAWTNPSVSTPRAVKTGSG